MRLIAAVTVVCVGLCSTAWADNLDNCKGGLADKNHVRRIDACTAVIARNPNDGAAYQSRSYAYERLNRGEEALQDAHKAVALLPRAETFVVRAAAYIAIGNTDRALDDLSQALRLNPKYQLAFVNRAYIHETQNRKDQAIADYRMGIQLNPASEHATYAREALRRLGVEK